MNQKHRSARLLATAGVLLLLALAFAGPVAAQEGVTYISEGACILEASGVDGCTANDVEYGAFTIIQVIEQCTDTSDTFTALISAELVATSQQRDDIAMWIALTDYGATTPGAEPGDGAIYGDSCYRQILSPKTADLGAVDVLSGEGPYASLDADDDFCGDIQQGVSTYANLPFDEGAVLTLPCTDPDNDGVVNVDACISWENNKNVACADVTQALPGTPSKCNCESLTVPGVNIRKVVVDKVTPQFPNSGHVFTFTFGGVEPPVQFTLTDAADPWVSDGLLPGNYSVAETDPGVGWTLDESYCEDGAGVSYDPANINLGGPSTTVTCTFTNTAGPTAVTLSGFSASAAGFANTMAAVAGLALAGGGLGALMVHRRRKQ